MTPEEMQAALKELQKQINLLQTKIINLSQIPSGIIRARHISEGVKYIQAGTAAQIPDAEIPSQGVVIYYETDTKKLKIYNRATEDWDETTLT